MCNSFSLLIGFELLYGKLSSVTTTISLSIVPPHTAPNSPSPIQKTHKNKRRGVSYTNRDLALNTRPYVPLLMNPIIVYLSVTLTLSTINPYPDRLPFSLPGVQGCVTFVFAGSVSGHRRPSTPIRRHIGGIGIGIGGVGSGRIVVCWHTA